MLAGGADTKGADDFISIADRHTEGAAHAGLFRAGFGHAAGVGLQIAHRDRLAGGDDLSGDAFTDGNDLHHVQYLRRQPDLRDEPKPLGRFMEPVDRAGLGIKLGERVAQLT